MFTVSSSHILLVWACPVSVVALGVDMVGSFSRGCGVEIKLCWVPCNE